MTRKNETIFVHARLGHVSYNNKLKAMMKKTKLGGI